MRRIILIAAHTCLVAANATAYFGLLPEAGLLFSMACWLYLLAVKS